MTPLKMPSDAPGEILRILRCPDCRQGGLEQAGGAFRCTACDRVYPVSDEIPDLRPAESLPLPGMYNDPDYRAWLAYQAKSKEYFYAPGSLMAAVQNAGHRIIRAMRPRSAGVVLDLGCGDGHHVPYLHQGETCLGLDIDRRSLLAARAAHPDFFVAQSDIGSLPLADASVHDVISVYSLEHILHLDFGLEEVRRVLAPGGALYVAVPSEGSLPWTLGRRLTTARRFAREGMDYLRAQEIDHVNCIWQIDKTLRRHFTVQERRFFPCRVPVFHANLVIVFRCAGRA